MQRHARAHRPECIKLNYIVFTNIATVAVAHPDLARFMPVAFAAGRRRRSQRRRWCVHCLFKLIYWLGAVLGSYRRPKAPVLSLYDDHDDELATTTTTTKPTDRGKNAPWQMLVIQFELARMPPQILCIDIPLLSICMYNENWQLNKYQTHTRCCCCFCV